MCGIFGIISNISLIDIISIIENLKHRGKDSFGISYFNTELHIEKPIIQLIIFISKKQILIIINQIKNLTLLMLLAC